MFQAIISQHTTCSWNNKSCTNKNNNNNNKKWRTTKRTTIYVGLRVYQTFITYVCIYLLSFFKSSHFALLKVIEKYLRLCIEDLLWSHENKISPQKNKTCNHTHRLNQYNIDNNTNTVTFSKKKNRNNNKKVSC